MKRFPLPNRDSTLNTADWRALLALVGEVGELGASSASEACAHLTAGAAKLIGGGPVWWSVVGGAADDERGAPVVRSHVHGLDPITLRRWERDYLRECRYQDHPMWPRTFARPGQSRSFLRRDLVHDDVWYRSAHVADWGRSFGVDDVVSAVMPVGGGAEVCVASMRPWGDSAFGARDRELLLLLAAHTAWLGRKPDPLALVADNNGVAELAPRHRSVLELLIAGRSEKQIAATMQVSPRTAHKYVEQIYRALGVSSRAELMALFIAR
jgi:DNA-binding CsgD family transcriptional regulator